MKRVKVRFAPEEGRRDIDVLFTASELDKQLTSLMERVEDPLAGVFTVSDAAGVSVALPEERIITVSSDNKKLRIVADDGVYRLGASMREFEKDLNPSMFLRISRYEIVNLRKVVHFDFSVSGTLRIEMANGYETWASRRFIQVVKTRLTGKG